MRRVLVLASLALVVLASATGVGSVSSAAADRSVSVAVADDEDAYLRYDPGTVTDGTWRPVLGNNVGDATVEVTVSADGSVARTTLTPGSRETLAVDGVACDDEATITAEAAAVRIELRRSVPCTTTPGDGDDGEVDDVEDDEEDDENGEGGGDGDDDTKGEGERNERSEGDR